MQPRISIHNKCTAHVLKLYTAPCLPQAMVNIPVTVQVQDASGVDLCTSPEQSTVEFRDFIEPNIIGNYEPPSFRNVCRILDLNQISCVTHGEPKLNCIGHQPLVILVHYSNITSYKPRQLYNSTAIITVRHFSSHYRFHGCNCQYTKRIIIIIILNCTDLYAGRRGQRVIVTYQVSLTCSDGCTRHRDNEQSTDNYKGQLNLLRTAIRSKRTVILQESYRQTRVSVIYFQGKKLGRIEGICRRNNTGLSIRNKLNLCGKYRIHKIGVVIQRMHNNRTGRQLDQL